MDNLEDMNEIMQEVLDDIDNRGHLPRVHFNDQVFPSAACVENALDLLSVFMGNGRNDALSAAVLRIRPILQAYLHLVAHPAGTERIIKTLRRLRRESRKQDPLGLVGYDIIVDSEPRIRVLDYDPWYRSYRLVTAQGHGPEQCDLGDLEVWLEGVGAFEMVKTEEGSTWP